MVGAISARGGDAVKTALIKAAAGMMAQMGPSALSVRDVAAAAGVNHGQVHHYFGGKRGLLRAAIRYLAEQHLANATRRAGGGPIPPALTLGQDSNYWRAIAHTVMEGDLDLARVEIEAGISVPRRAMHALMERAGATEGDIDFKAHFAAGAALQLGWAAFEDFVLLLADVDPADHDELRDRVKDLVKQLTNAE